jgi:hypothetical protein
MRKLVQLLFVVIGLSISSPTLLASCFMDGDGGGENTEIPIIEESEGNIGGPVNCAPSVVPLKAYYNPSLCYIAIDFLFNMGMTLIVIENTTTGEHSRFLVNGDAGVTRVSISGNPGCWRL